MAVRKLKRVTDNEPSLDDILSKMKVFKTDRAKYTDIKDDIETELVLTGRPSLDYVTDGGFPKNSLIKICSEKSGGKSSMSIQIAPLFGKRILYVDSEYTITTNYVEQLLGKELLDTLDFKVVNADSTEMICDLIKELIPHVDVVIWDSLQNSASNEEWQKDASERSRANRALVLGTEIPKIMYLMDKHETTLIVLSQVSANQNKKNKWDPEYISSGGNRLDHNSSLTLWLFPSSKDKTSKETVYGYDTVRGRDVRIVCEKNKNGVPFRTVRSRFVYGEGYSILDDVFFAAKNLGIIRVGGSWYSFGDVKLGQGEVKAKSFLGDNPEMFEQIKTEVYQSYILADKENTIEGLGDIVDLD